MLDLVSPEKQKEAQPAGVEERPAEGEKPLEEKQPAEGEEQALVKDQPATKEEGDGSGNKGDSGKPAAEKKRVPATIFSTVNKDGDQVSVKLKKQKGRQDVFQMLFKGVQICMVNKSVTNSEIFFVELAKQFANDCVEQQDLYTVRDKLVASATPPATPEQQPKESTSASPEPARRSPSASPVPPRKRKRRRSKQPEDPAKQTTVVHTGGETKHEAPARSNAPLPAAPAAENSSFDQAMFSLPF